MKIECIGKQHFCFYAEGPSRLEVKVMPDGHVVAFGYEGTKIDKDQEPTVVFDSLFNKGAA